MANGMEKQRKAPRELSLYHGTTALIGDRIQIRSDTGVGYNRYNLGNGFYTSLSLEASRLFAHLSVMNRRMRGEEKPQDPIALKVYQVNLHQDIKLLNADHPLDPAKVRGVLRYAGVADRYLAYCKDDQLISFKKAVELLDGGKNWRGNGCEWMTTFLGYDALRILEGAWSKWDYYPQDIGVDWDSCLKRWKLEPPDTVVVYNTDKIESFSEYSVPQLGLDADAQWLGKMESRAGIGR